MKLTMWLANSFLKIAEPSREMGKYMMTVPRLFHRQQSYSRNFLGCSRHTQPSRNAGALGLGIREYRSFPDRGAALTEKTTVAIQDRVPSLLAGGNI